ncbi:MAG: polysaccharide pyruvyl transferase family protein [Saprospiraceae bacterium]
MKIGILTFHRCINYGSYWQARCLVEAIQTIGYQAVILDHVSRRVNVAEWKCALQPTLPTPVPAADHALYREKMQRFFTRFNTLPLSPSFPLEEPEQMEYYDLIIVGSDEVWNLSHPWYGECPLFYGDGLRAPYIISYAASFGNYNSEHGLDHKWANKLQNFNKISVRDINSQQIIKNALGITPSIVLDPCLQFSIKTEQKYYNHLPEHYIAVYGHNFSDYFINHIQQFAKAKQLPLISIGYRNDWADMQWLTADPIDFTNFIAQSESVTTNFFHGCVFSLIYKKPFVCETSPYRSIKVQDLMQQLGGEKHLVDVTTSAGEYHNRLSKPLDPDIFQQIERLQEKSNTYLNHALTLKSDHSHETTII